LRMEIDDRDFRVIIGTKGATIRQLQDDSGANIDLDRDNSQLAFRGTEEQTEKAKELVDALLQGEKAEREKRMAERAAEDEKWENENKKEGGGGGGGGGGNKKKEDSDEEVEHVFQYAAVPLGAATADNLSRSAARRLRKKQSASGDADQDEAEVLGLKKTVKPVAPKPPPAAPGAQFHADNKAYSLRL